MTDESIYSRGDQIVHSQYGVGKIVDLSEKKLGEKTILYYVVETTNSTYWLPVAKADNERVRLIVSPKKIEEAIETLQQKPGQMDDQHEIRKERITEVTTSGELIQTAELVRDLAYRKVTTNLNSSEQKAYENLMTRLVMEWAASMKTTVDFALQRVNQLLQEHYPSI